MMRLLLCLVLVVLTGVGCGAASPPLTVGSVPTVSSAPVVTQAPTTSPPPPTTATTVSAFATWGQWSQWDDGFKVTVQKPEEDTKGRATDGNKIVVADVLIENKTNETRSYNPLYFELQDSEGYVYQSWGGTDRPHFSSGDLMPGLTVRGFVAFEVPTTAHAVGLTFNDYDHMAAWRD